MRLGTIVLLFTLAGCGDEGQADDTTAGPTSAVSADSAAAGSGGGSSASSSVASSSATSTSGAGAGGNGGGASSTSSTVSTGSGAPEPYCTKSQAPGPQACGGAPNPGYIFVCPIADFPNGPTASCFASAPIIGNPDYKGWCCDNPCAFAGPVLSQMKCGADDAFGCYETPAGCSPTEYPDYFCCSTPP